MKPGWLLSPKLSTEQKKIVRMMQARLGGRSVGGGRAKGGDYNRLYWILSSGTSSVGEVKAIGLSQEALEASAMGVNRHLQAARDDRWLLALPTYHVGGLGILFRARLSGSRVFTLPKWKAKNFVASVEKNEVTLTSLVPTQVHDLVSAGLKSPSSLRAVVVGGGALASDLYGQARALGWPVLPSYGLSECSSQVATAELDSPRLKILSHVEAKTIGGRICVKSQALCSYIARGRASGEFSLEDPRREGWFLTEDLGEIRQGFLKMTGRRDDLVKVLGELVSVPAVEAKVRELGVVVAIPGGRAGHRLVLFTDTSESLQLWVQKLKAYNQTALGPERILQLCWLPELPRAELGKIKKVDLF